MKNVAFTLAIMILLGLSDAVQATVLEKKSFEDLVVQSELAAVGRVFNVESHPTPDGRYAYTYVTVGELEVLKGTYRQPVITLRMDGGPQGNGKLLVVPGIPNFQVGEKVVLFVRGNGQRICPLVGWEQGLLRVVRDQRSGQEILKTSDGLKIRAVEKGDFVVGSITSQSRAEASAGTPDDGEPQSLTHEQTAPAVLTLDSLKSQVRAVMIKAGPKAQPKAQVMSIEFTLDSPQTKTDKQPRRIY
jgi:hypothetical protein